ncbi:MAG TPA: hypothetical protein GX697_06455 [Firmicutes bacterium]|nr:hypothetical protein [Bacillota bacterium]
MEGLVLLVIYAVISLLRGAAKESRKAPPTQRKRPVSQDRKEIFDTLEKRFEELFFPEEIQQKPGKKPAAPVPSPFAPSRQQQVVSATRQREVVPAAKTVKPELQVSQKEVSVFPSPDLSPPPSPLTPLFAGKNGLVRGIILAEVLGPPKSRRGGRPFKKLF